jgi:hypothetical protein
MATMFAARGKLNALQRHRTPDDPDIKAPELICAWQSLPMKSFVRLRLIRR